MQNVLSSAISKEFLAASWMKFPFYTCSPKAMAQHGPDDIPVVFALHCKKVIFAFTGLKRDEFKNAFCYDDL
jgi:hypothetical protein